MFDYLAMAYKDRDHCCMLTQMYIFGAETHLGAGVMSAFVFLLAAIA